MAKSQDYLGRLVRTSVRFAIEDTLRVFPVPHMQARREGPVTHWEDPPFFSPRTSWDLFEGGFVTVETGTYVVSRHDSLGQVLWKRRMEITAPAISKDDRVRRIKAKAELYGTSTKLPLFLLERRLRSRFPEFGPRVASMKAVSGVVWIERFDTRENPFGTSGVWDLFDGTGGYLGSVRSHRTCT